MIRKLLLIFRLKKVLLALAVMLLALIAAAIAFDVPRFLIGLATYGGQAREGSLRVGDSAPIVTVYDIGGAQTHALGQWIGEQPLVLIFGSFT